MADKHKHTSDCYEITLSCAKTEHTHEGIACYKQTGALKCHSREHTHSRTSCYSPAGPTCGHQP